MRWLGSLLLVLVLVGPTWVHAVTGTCVNGVETGKVCTCAAGSSVQEVGFTASASTEYLTRSSDTSFANGEIVQLSGTLPTGLSTVTNYYVVNLDYSNDKFQLSSTSGGAAINLTTAGGAITVTRAYPCTNSTTPDTACGTGFICNVEAAWGASSSESAGTSFIAASDIPLTCGTLGTGSCITSTLQRGAAESTGFTNACSDHTNDGNNNGTCASTGGACDSNADCSFCREGTATDGGKQICANDAACGTGGRAVISGSAFEYCGNDNFRYVIQPRKLITFIDTLGNPQSGNVNRKICKNCTNGQKFTTLDLDTTIPYTPDSKYYSTSDDRIQIQKTGIYEITGQISMDDIEQSTSRGHDALEMKLERCHCSTYGSDNCDTENSDCEDTADGVKVNASGCKDDGTGVGDDTDLATNNNHAEQKWCVLDGGQAASYLNKKTRGSYSVTRTVFAKLNKYDFIRLRGMINDPKTAYGLLMPFGSFLKIEYVGEAYED